MIIVLLRNTRALALKSTPPADKIQIPQRDLLRFAVNGHRGSPCSVNGLTLVFHIGKQGILRRSSCRSMRKGFFHEAEKSRSSFRDEGFRSPSGGWFRRSAVNPVSSDCPGRALQAYVDLPSQIFDDFRMSYSNTRGISVIRIRPSFSGIEIEEVNKESE